jgi:glycosyltransferase involved in cell wall biosynthesis
MDQLPSDWRLVLAGAPNGYRAQEILDQIATSRSKERITVAGYVSTEELDQLYAAASIFAFPSLDEGFGIPLIEAMARNVPVLTSHRSALAELAGDAALLIDPEDTDEIAQGLKRLIEDRSLREELTRRGIDRAAQYSWRRAVQETAEVYAALAPYF